MTVSSNQTKEFLYRCQLQLELLCRREDFAGWIENVRFRFQTSNRDYNLKSWASYLEGLDSQHRNENGEPKNRRDYHRLPSEQFRLAVKTIMLDSKLDNFWYKPIVVFILTNNVSKAVNVLPPNNGISIDYEWDQRYGGETIKLTIGMATNKKQLDEAMSEINKLQTKYASSGVKQLKTIRPRRVFNRDLLLYDLAQKNPIETAEEKKKILDTVNQTVESDKDIIGYEKFDTIVNKITKEIQTVI